MYADPGAAQAIIKQLNRWYRKRAKPRGTIDHYYRGTRMSYNAACRGVACLFSLFLLSIAGLLFFVPSVTADKSPLVVLGLKIGWLGIVAVAFFAPLQAFREFVIVNDEELMKSNLFGRQTRFEWKDIAGFQIKPDDNKVIFRMGMKAPLTMSLAYDGWRDFLELAEKHLAPALNFQLVYALAHLDAKRPIALPTKKSRLARWFSFGRGR